MTVTDTKTISDIILSELGRMAYHLGGLFFALLALCTFCSIMLLTSRKNELEQRFDEEEDPQNFFRVIIQRIIKIRPVPHHSDTFLSSLLMACLNYVLENDRFEEKTLFNTIRFMNSPDALSSLYAVMDNQQYPDFCQTRRWVSSFSIYENMGFDEDKELKMLAKRLMKKYHIKTA